MRLSCEVSVIHSDIHMDLGVSENRGPQSRTPNSRILIIRTPKYGTPHFRKPPFGGGSGFPAIRHWI